MKNKEITVQLILQDMKRAQLITGLRNLHLITDVHESDLLEFVLLFMGASPEPGQVFPKIMDDVNEVYGGFLDRAIQFPVSGRGEELHPLAEQCYKNMAACMRWNEGMKGFHKN